MNALFHTGPSSLLAESPAGARRSRSPEVSIDRAAIHRSEIRARTRPRPGTLNGTPSLPGKVSGGASPDKSGHRARWVPTVAEPRGLDGFLGLASNPNEMRHRALARSAASVVGMRPTCLAVIPSVILVVDPVNILTEHRR